MERQHVIIKIGIVQASLDGEEFEVRNNLKVYLLVVMLFSFTHNAAAGAADLPKQHKKWLEEEVVYIIAPVEKEIFLQLKTDREREMFIKAFWKHRDPTLSTPENELRTEHYRRINYANQFFGRGLPIEGWKTDRGRIYIILGAPNDIQRFEGKNQIYPTEVWFFQGLTDKGLPPGFNLVFYQEGGLGEYKLYSPLGDGPQALLTSYLGDPLDYMAAYSQLREFEPELSGYAMSLIPGERSDASGRPTMSSDILVNRVESTPVRGIEDRYARKFLEYKDRVEVEYTANYMDCDSLVKVLKDSSGIYFVHYAIEPERLSVNQYQNKFYTTLKLNGTVSTIKGKTVYQFDKAIPLEFEEEQIKQVSNRPISIRDMFPLIPGKYRLSVLVKNEISKEFTSLERTLLIPGEKDRIQMTSLLLGYRMNRNIPTNNRLRPFQAGNYQMYFQANRVFLRKDDLVLAYQIHGLSLDEKEKAVIKYNFSRDGKDIFSLSRKIREYKSIPDFVEKFPLKNFSPAHYRVRVSLIVDSQEKLFESDEFDVTYMESITRPWIYSKLLSGTENPVYAYVLGTQLFNTGQLDTAEAKLEAAFHKNPENAEFALNLARVYMKKKNYDEVPAVLLPFVNLDEPPKYEIFFILGRAYQYRGEFAQAIDIFEKAMKHHGLNTNCLNVIGECYFQLKDMSEALTAWMKSLEINADQPKIKKNVETLKEKK